MVAVQNATVSFVVFALAVNIPGSSASEFLRTRSPEEMQVTLELVERTLLLELSMETERLKHVQAELQPLYQVMPKNEDGSLEPAVVRYALHRHFAGKHGWYIKGLDSAGQAWNSTAPTDLMNFRVASHIQSLFEQRLHGQGMGLHDLAVFAATLSDFVHNEALSDVVDLFSAFDLPPTLPVGAADADKVIRGYILQILDGNTTIKSLRSLQDTEQYMVEVFPAWNDFKVWVEDVRRTISMKRRRQGFASRVITLESIAEEVRELSDRIGAFQDIECRSLKSSLADLEYKGTGRVLLSDFYRAGVQGDVLFIESVDFLRKLGALDESDSMHPSVIIPNYLTSPANCLASTSFHSICCMDECQGLMSRLEQSIAADSANPDQITYVVEHLRSDTVDAPRNLSASLRSRLEDIATHHGGLVPLHGRLFSQFMHHAYPLECAYPHVSGTTNPLSPEEWMDATGADEIAAPEKERRQYMRHDANLPDKSDKIAWTSHEELVVVSRKSPIGKAKGSSLPRKVAALLAILAVAVPLAKAATRLVTPSSELSNKDHFV